MDCVKLSIKRMCDEIRSDLTKEVDILEKKWFDRIEMIGDEIDLAMKNVNQSKKAKTSEDVLFDYCFTVERDEKLKMLELATTIPRYEASKLTSSLESAFDHLKISPSSFKTEQTYIPNVMEVLFKAAVKDDVEPFKHVLRNQNLPRDALAFIINYKFPLSMLSHSSGELKGNKIPQIAAINGSLGVLRFLLDNNAQLDMVDNAGYVVPIYIIKSKASNLPEAEDIYIKLLQFPRVKRSCKPDSVLSFSILANFPLLCRFALQELGANVNATNGKLGFSPLQQAIAAKKNLIYYELMKHNPSLVYKNDLGQNCLHVACFFNFHEIISDLLNRWFPLIHDIDKQGKAPVMTAIERDSLESFKIIAKYLKSREFLNNLKEMAQQMKANRIVDWLNSLKITHEPKILPKLS